jgi:serine/threonine protein kinase
LGSAAGEYFSRGKKNGNKGAVSKDGYAKKDRLPKGCVENHWHSLNFPSCNDIHEIIPLGGALGERKRKHKIPADLGEGDKSADMWSKADKEESMKLGFVGSGLWRQVWKVQPRGDHVDDLSDEEVAVLKIMKMEHPVDPRNFDRHRRDALVMERLTSSPYVVGIYGFCGNTVLTEFAGKTLEDYLNDDDENMDVYSKESVEGKIQLALDVMKGLKALHTIPGGPIVHADIQAKQYLFDPKKGVRVNDFNRCRFLPENENTGKSCQVKIPSAPGLNRSPEEYEKYKIDEKIDIYSTANILFRILTGKRPWMGLLRKEQQSKIIKGMKPPIDEKFLVPGTIEAELADIINHAYEYDPKERWSASQIVETLESILKKKDGKDNSLRGNNN